MILRVQIWTNRISDLSRLDKICPENFPLKAANFLISRILSSIKTLQIPPRAGWIERICIFIRSLDHFSIPLFGKRRDLWRGPSSYRCQRWNRGPIRVYLAAFPSSENSQGRGWGATERYRRSIRDLSPRERMGDTFLSTCWPTPHSNYLALSCETKKRLYWICNYLASCQRFVSILNIVDGAFLGWVKFSFLFHSLSLSLIPFTVYGMRYLSNNFSFFFFLLQSFRNEIGRDN